MIQAVTDTEVYVGSGGTNLVNGLLTSEGLEVALQGETDSDSVTIEQEIFPEVQIRGRESFQRLVMCKLRDI
jgi:hypothetical protein